MKMSKLDFLLNAIDALRKMERDGTSAEACNNFDRFIREQIFGAHKLELTFEELCELQDYYIATL